MDNNYHLTKNYFKKPVCFGEISVSQIGRMYCNSTTVIKPHKHTDLFELTIVTGGKGAVITNGVSTQVSLGDIYLSFPGDIHEIVTDKTNPLKFDFWAFKCNEGEFHDPLSDIQKTHADACMRVFCDEYIKQTVANVISEIDDTKIFSEKLVFACLTQVIIYLIRDFKKIPQSKLSVRVTEHEALCYKLMNYIDTHIYSIRSLTELEGVTGYSYNYLSTLFKKTTSLTLHQYYNDKKTEIISQLIKENRLSLTEISEAFGYSTVYAFSKAFKNTTGLCPREFRKKAIGSKTVLLG